MGKLCDDTVLDGLLDIVNNADEQYLCVGEPASRAAADSTSVIPAATPTFSSFANGDTNGRKVTVQANNGLTADATGTVDHVALCIASGTVLLYVTTCTSQAVTSGNTVNIGAWDVEVADPT